MKVNREYLNKIILERTGETKISHACLKMGREIGVKASCVNNFRLYCIPNEENLIKILRYLNCDLRILFNIEK
ncbi:hypothetical protein D2A34_05215 [Clostridium chromiireducens]|uniref:XRE family transcriptional regulator n=1 Tax=Clostridium chromiireducens TaxID=225345 RepID=A0A399IUN1_9CLOT|nr:hypothetical protein [Clostridium chromiireducens]RII36783.1 hypothetical protein D2A34_05215 [Clostridium chromiireducens]